MTQTRRLSGGETFDRLELMVWGDHQHVAALTKGQALVIGREAPAHLRLDAEGLSRRHARIAWDSNDGPAVEDLGSTNGTRLNGQPISGRAPLVPGDLLQLGEVRISISGRRDGEAAGALFDSYERFVARIDDELVRARLFGRSFGVLRLRPLSPVHVSRFSSSVLDVLRPVDRIGAFGSSELLVLLPEADETTTRTVGKTVRAKCAVPLAISTCVFPGDGADAQTLLAVLASGVNTLKRGQTLAHSTKALQPAGPLISSERMRALFATARRVAGTRIPVMINGETGSGKEVLARAVHENSQRSSGPFVAVNCAAIAATLIESTLFGHERGAFTGANRRSLGLFEQADGGTIFLDEVGELSAATQAALLRVLETQRFFRVGGERDVKVDVRVLAATHRNLEQAVLAGTFRADLRFRLEGVTLAVPPLRERAEEIVPLARHFFAELTSSMGRQLEGFTPAALSALAGYAWPGNIRELRNVIERAVVISAGTHIDAGDLPENVVQRRAVLAESSATPSAPPELELPTDTGLQAFVTEQQQKLERRLITRALEQCGGNQTKAAKLLKLPLRTLVHKIKALDLR